MEGQGTLMIALDSGAYKPKRAHDQDAGLDLRSPESKVIPARGGIIVDTGVHVELPKGTAGLLVSKSGLNVKHGITSTGLIDEGYTGSIKVKLYNHTESDYRVESGDKITQLVVIPVLHPDIRFKSADELTETERGDGCLGSTGK